jgi:ABC-type transporter Mla MlaB component
MLHVTTEKGEDESIVRLSGDLTGDFVAEADQALAAADGRLVIDASQLQSADPKGLAWLVAALDRGVQITGLSGYLEMRLSQLREQSGS